METELTVNQVVKDRVVLVVRKGTKARLDELMQKLGIQAPKEDQRLSLLIDKVDALLNPTIEDA